MKFKLDEDLGTTALRSFETAGHDTSTVHLQNLAGAPDEHVLRICTGEQRILVTLDLDFANSITYHPRSTSGIAVLHMSARCAIEESDAPPTRRLDSGQLLAVLPTGVIAPPTMLALAARRDLQRRIRSATA